MMNRFVQLAGGPARALAALVMALGVLLTGGGWAWSAWQDGRELERRNQALGDLVRALSQADSQAVSIADRNRLLLRQLQEDSSALGRLAQRLQAADAENVRLTGLLATAEDSLSGTGDVTRVDTVSVGCNPCLRPGDFVTGVLARDPFRVQWRFTAMDSLRATVFATIRAELVQADLPDGTVTVFARPLSPNTTLEVERLEWQPPPPPEVGFHWGTALRVGVVAVPAGALIWELVR